MYGTGSGTVRHTDGLAAADACFDLNVIVLTVALPSTAQGVPLAADMQQAVQECL